MKTSLRTSMAAVAIAYTALAFASGAAHAQTENVVASVAVQNTLTITEVDPLNFGVVAAVTGAAQTATLAINPTSGALTPTNNAPALFAIIDNTAATPAQITVEDAADGATINVEIDNVVNPTFGGSSFTLAGWSTSWNGGAATARTAATPWTQTFSAAFGGGVNTLDIGATITSVAATTYGDGTYNGNFDVIFSY